ncbi:uncharacterized protein LOC6546323 [Drosophila erecta]|uniref:Uncharacterized protein n=1 Tax=Drosophila erecta TaxID=7220 RepID=B3NHU6_DROER|nr:uncharacterized protein LOC6546323 [Drosophila erecta]EDV51961.1 uncharacterized protein Dere_GG15807 [Drosophila erecta]
MPYHDRAKARLENEVVLLRREVASLRSRHIQHRKYRQEQAVLQARLEQEIQLLQRELAAAQLHRNERECGGAEQCSRLNHQVEKLDEHVVKQEKYIAFLEEQINHTRNKYQQRMTDVRQNAELVEKELKRVRREIKAITEQAGAVDSLQQQVGFLSAKLDRRNAIISKYEAQQDEIITIMASLQKQKDKIRRDQKIHISHDDKADSSSLPSEQPLLLKPCLQKTSDRKKQRKQLKFREGVKEDSSSTDPDKPPDFEASHKPSKSASLKLVSLSSALRSKLSNQEQPTVDQ